VTDGVVEPDAVLVAVCVRVAVPDPVLDPVPLCVVVPEGEIHSGVDDRVPEVV
jgi:hypothetical protein